MSKPITYGNMGEILRINLSDNKFSTEDATKYYQDYLGGRSLNHILLFQDVNVAKVQPFDPENEIIFSVGPLGGTTFPGSGRFQATYIAPLPYSGFGDANCGGAVGPEIKYSGFDTIVIGGKADKPTYVFIEDDKIEFMDATDLWGKGTIECTAILRKRHPECEVLVIGPAGENLVRYANIRTKLTNTLGRGGGGAVMGSKNLKALVLKGSKPVRLFDQEKFFDICQKIQKDLMDPEFGPIHSITYDSMSKYGTPGITRMIGATGMTPIKNWQECGIWEDDKEIDGKYIVETWGAKRESCFTCPVHCHAVYETDGEHAHRGGGPEYETTAALGHKCLLPDGRKVLKLNHLCNELGLDTVEAGAMISSLMEWYDKGMIDAEFTDGLEMTWGNGEAMIELLPKIAFRQGCGDLLAEGPYRVGKQLGEAALNCVYHQKGMCATGVETRSAIGAMLSFALAPRGSHHLSGLPTAEWVNNPDLAIYLTGYKEAGELLSYHPLAKSRLVQFYENLFELSDSLGICKFNFGHLGYWHDKPEDMDKMWDYLSKAIYYATGIEYTKEKLLEIGERAYQIERCIVVMRGIRKKDDMPNWRCLNETCPGDHPVNPIPLPEIDEEKFVKILDAYYELRGWDSEGIPTEKTLNALGLEEVAKRLYSQV